MKGRRQARTHLEPYHNEVPESDHTELGSGVSTPRPSVFDGHNIHEVEDGLERQDARQEADQIPYSHTRSDGDGSA